MAAVKTPDIATDNVVPLPAAGVAVLTPKRTRPADEIIGDIVDILRSKFRPGVRNPKHVISEHIFRHDSETGLRLDPPQPSVTSAQIRKRQKHAKRARKALVALGSLPGIGADEYRRVCGALEQCATARAPDRRAKPMIGLAAYIAVTLIELVAKERPTTTQGGDAHLIGQLVHEALTGEAPSEKAGLLRAVKNIINPKKKPRSGQLTLETSASLVTISPTRRGG
jgi:hypothetical protein